MKLTACSALFCLFSALISKPASARTWKDVSGRSIEADLVKVEGNQVTLRLDGKDYTMPMTKLSAEDQAWIKTQAALPAWTAPVAAPSKYQLGGVELKCGAKTEFELPLSQDLLAKWNKRMGSNKEIYTDVDMSRAAVGIYLPSNFDPARSWPIMIVSVTNSGRDNGKYPSSVKSMDAFTVAAQTHGWVVLAADCPKNLSPGAPYSRAVLAEAGLDAMSALWPASKEWPIATGGFSGGAKYSGWLAGWFCEGGRKVLGMFEAGCNEDMATMALNALKPPQKEFKKVKVFLSTGTNDKIAGPTQTETVAKSLKRTGFDEVKTEVFEGAHEINREHISTAMKWFTEVAAK
jgi:hypothetical protein